MDNKLHELKYDELLKIAIRHIKNHDGYSYRERWSLVGDMFQLGSGYSRDLCRLVGEDPYTKIYSYREQDEEGE